MADLIDGHYPQFDDFWKFTGLAANVNQGDIPPRSNGRVLGVAGLADTSAALTTAVCTSVAVPVEAGDVISKITVLVGGTAAGTPTHSFAALYSGIGTPALLAQSTDGTSGAIAASGAYSFSLASSQLITPANAPNGFVYASIMVAATTVPSLATVSVATAVGYKWFTNGPLFMAATHGSGLTSTAPGTITSQTAQAATPLVFLT